MCGPNATAKANNQADWLCQYGRKECSPSSGWLIAVWRGWVVDCSRQVERAGSRQGDTLGAYRRGTGGARALRRRLRNREWAGSGYGALLTAGRHSVYCSRKRLVLGSIHLSLQVHHSLPPWTVVRYYWLRAGSAPDPNNVQTGQTRVHFSGRRRRDETAHGYGSGWAPGVDSELLRYYPAVQCSAESNVRAV